MTYFVLVEGMTVEQRRAFDVELGDKTAVAERERESFQAVAERMRAQRDTLRRERSVT